MNAVIADASCLILFTNIRRLGLLEQLFGRVWITTPVKEEYGLALPSFIAVHDPEVLERLDGLMLLLDRGEASSIALALEHPDSKLIIDEKKGRRVASALGLQVTGTVGLLLDAAERGLVQADRDLLDDLLAARFRVSPSLADKLLRKK